MQSAAGHASKIHRLRYWIVLAILLGVGVFFLHSVWFSLRDPQSHVAQALVGGLIAAAATAAGALPVLFSQRLSERTQDSLFGFGAGVMLAASAFSLVVPGIAAAQNLGYGTTMASLVVGLAILLGGALLLTIDHVVPHEHFIKGVEGHAAAMRLRRTWLFVFAIALHNLPEGLAIGVAYAGTDLARASALTVGIAIQDIPEGLVVAVALVAVGYSRVRAFMLGAATGLIEPVGAVLGAAIVEYSAAMLPWGLGFAAGAMLFVISHEIIPESHRKGHEVSATVGLLLGFVLMMFLDTSLG